MQELKSDAPNVMDILAVFSRMMVHSTDSRRCVNSIITKGMIQQMPLLSLPAKYFSRVYANAHFAGALPIQLDTINGPSTPFDDYTSRYYQ
ncbi:BA75_03326T0 [Komagataella pastoris]|uniref:BA75_03326T0 n=1 Tax=Komagataella pastoris TaxID=4922 RepID=A0A1B2JDD7_PICPA|nr:BA75_03326T0 [Komagataella pastoris]